MKVLDDTAFKLWKASGPGQTPYFTWAESNANEKYPFFSLINLHYHSIR